MQIVYAEELIVKFGYANWWTIIANTKKRKYFLGK